jgi:hypothetical protein
VSVGRLPLVVDALGVSISYFYGHDNVAAGTDTAVIADSIGLLTERHAVELLECFRAMTYPQRNALLEIAKAVAASNAAGEPANAGQGEANGRTGLPA